MLAPLFDVKTFILLIKDSSNLEYNVTACSFLINPESKPKNEKISDVYDIGKFIKSPLLIKEFPHCRLIKHSGDVHLQHLAKIT